MAVGYLLPAGWLTDVDPRLVWRDECLDAARSRRAVLFGAGMLFPLATSGAMEPFPFRRARLARWSAVYKTLVPACWRRYQRCCRKPVRAAPGLLMTLMGLLIVLCWLPLATRMSHQGQPV